MRLMYKFWMTAVLLMAATAAAAGPSDAEIHATVDLFKHAGESSAYFTIVMATRCFQRSVKEPSS
jgi:hypothetical protein